MERSLIGLPNEDARLKSVEALTLENEALRLENYRLRETARRGTFLPAGVFPMLRDMGCTHRNGETPRLLQQSGGGRLVVDVGLGHDAHELVEAVSNGFNVIGIEMLPANIASLQKALGLDPRIAFVELEWSGASGEDEHWEWPANVALLPPPLTPEGRGFAYIVHTALGNTTGEASWPNDVGPSYSESLATSAGPSHVTGYGRTPIVRLDDLLPTWVGETGVYLLKLDTQGWELPILQGSRGLLDRRLFAYVIYEFSPWLMWRERTGRPVDLVELLPSLGAVCFDTLGPRGSSLNALPRPSLPIAAYVERLQSGKYPDSAFGLQNGMPLFDIFGPWDDITCAFLDAPK